jgi:hypothetical protein
VAAPRVRDDPGDALQLSAPRRLHLPRYRGGTDGSSSSRSPLESRRRPIAQASIRRARQRRAELRGRLTPLRRERRHLPNIIAVDIYRTGDLFDVVRE